MNLKYSVSLQTAGIQRMTRKSVCVRIAEPRDITSIEMGDQSSVATINQDRLIFGLEQDWRRVRSRYECKLNIKCKRRDGLCAV